MQTEPQAASARGTYKEVMSQRRFLTGLGVIRRLPLWCTVGTECVIRFNMTKTPFYILYMLLITEFTSSYLSIALYALVRRSVFLRARKTFRCMRTALFWVITRRVVVIYCRRFDFNYRSNSQGSNILKSSVLGLHFDTIGYHYISQSR
jgi:hypothetical protein